MSTDVNGQWIGLGVGDVDNPNTPRNAPNWRAIELLSKKLLDKYQWVRDAGFIGGPTYTEGTAAMVEQFCQRTGLPVIRDPQGRAVANVKMRARLGSYPPPAPVLPLFFTVEGHMSDMNFGPVADTANRLAAEGLCRHQPIGYVNSALPFKTETGVQELARLVGSFAMDNGVPFPAGTPWALGGFSEGYIAIFEFFVRYLQPGQPLAWRLPDLVGVLGYGGPNRETGSIAPWSVAQASNDRESHGLDPLRRFGLAGFPKTPDYWMDVWRNGDIFTDNSNDKAGEIKASVYQAVARGDVFSNPYSLAAQIGDLFETPASQIIGIVMAIISGVGFLAQQNNPHYAPFDIEGGVTWMRGRLSAAAANAA